MTNSTTSFNYSCTEQHYASQESLPLIIINTAQCEAVISLYGAQVLEFKAANKAALLWLSPTAVFKHGTAIRGGIPICAPWFGSHPQHALNHGFARTSLWQQQSIKEQPSGEVVVKLTLSDNDASRLYGYEQFEMMLTITLGLDLSIDFSFTNHADTPQLCEWALHSYFAVEDCASTHVTGLNALVYHDKVSGDNHNIASKTEHFQDEVDRFWVTGSAEQTIHSANNITISGENCPSVIVWNPGKLLAASMKDIVQYEKFVCVERGAINTNAWLVTESSTQTASMTLKNS